MKRLYPVFFLALLALFLLRPALILDAAKAGLFTWFETVVPALFPFFVLNGLLFSFGIVDLLSPPLAPLTRRLFRLPGEAAFVLITGYTSGSPVSAALVAALEREGKIQRKEGERLLALSANPSPVFMLSVAALSFLNRPDLGLPLLAIVYGSNLLLGIVWGLIAGETPPAKKKAAGEKAKKIPPAGKALLEAITTAIGSLGLIGGLIIVFFILIALINALPLGSIAMAAFPNLDGKALSPLFHGVFEMTAGLKALPESGGSLRIQLVIAAGILAFGGLCVHMQIAGQIMETKLSMQKFVAYKVLQATIAMLIAVVVPIHEEVLAWGPALSPGVRLSAALLLGPYALLTAAGIAFAAGRRIFTRDCRYIRRRR